MEATEEMDVAATQSPGQEKEMRSISPSISRAGSRLIPQQSGGSCSCGGSGGQCSCGTGDVAATYVYALGRIGMRFPTIGLEKEFAQATGRSETSRLTDQQALHAVISQRQNRYLARQLCWVFSIEGLETYLLQPGDPSDFDLLLDTIRRDPTPLDIDVIIGVLGPIAPPEMCNGLLLPVVTFDQIYSFDRESLIKSIPRPEKIAQKDFEAASREMFDRIMLMADNAGATDENRALNYLSVRYPALYGMVAEAYGRNSSLTGVEVRTSSLSSVRNIVEVIFTVTNRTTDVDEKFFVRVDVTEEFPFLVTRLSPYYDR